MKICFLASGNGGNLKFIYLAQKLHLIKNIELAVIADRECGSIEFAKYNSIHNRVIKYKRDDNQALKNELESINPDIIVTNWHKIIDEEVVTKYKGKMINLHYSLLPAFSGLIGIAPIEEAYKNNSQYVGATCHYVDSGVDTGSIISQAIVKTNIPIELAIQSVFEKACLILIDSIFKITKQEITKLNNNDKFDFSPMLKIDDKLFDSNFWKRLSAL
jgi:phosphoribosylglycinamide formyltransferase-1